MIPKIVQTGIKNSKILMSYALLVIVGFMPINGYGQKESQLQKNVIQDVTMQRFGVDGATLRFEDKIKEIGDGWSGLNDVRWGLLEPQPPRQGQHFYSWAKADNFIRNFQKTDRKLQINIRIYNNWALEYSTKMKAEDPGSGQKVGAIVRIKPEHLSDWAKFITEFVERYDADGYNDMPGIKYPITHIQIESEADNVWVDAGRFVQALCVAYNAAKKTYPEVQIMAAGFNVGEFFVLSQREQEELLRSNAFVKHKIDFLQEFFPQAQYCFDILSLHLNRGDYEDIPLTVKWFQQQMETNGYQKPIWSEDTSSAPLLADYGREGREKLRLLEQGDPKTIDWFRQEQAKFLVKKSLVAFASYVDKVFLSTSVDWSTYFMPEWRHQGFLDAKGNPKPAFYTFKLMVAKLDGFTKVNSLSQTDEYCYKVEFKNKNPVFVLWNESGEKTVDLSHYILSPNVKITHIITEQGKTDKDALVDIEPSNKVRISETPIFVEEVVK